MKIAITMRVIEDQGYNELRDVISHDWIKFFESHSIDCCLVPNGLSDYCKFFRSEKPDAVILSNGNDVVPEVGECFPVKSPDLLRNNSEILILDSLINIGIPVLGVCRGMHFINHYFRGRIKTNINAGVERENSHVANNHIVNLIYQPLITMLGTESIMVNSFHNQGIQVGMISDELLVTGVAGEFVEMFIHKSLPIAGIQWHPERSGTDKKIDYALIGYLLNRYKGLI